MAEEIHEHDGGDTVVVKETGRDTDRSGNNGLMIAIIVIAIILLLLLFGGGLFGGGGGGDTDVNVTPQAPSGGTGGAGAQ